MTGLTEALAQFIHDKTVQDFPPAAIDKAKRALADTFAVILAGAGSEVAPPLMRYVEQASDSGTSPILGSGRMVSPEMAALCQRDLWPRARLRRRAIHDASASERGDFAGAHR